MLARRHPTTTRDLGAPPGWKPERHGRCAHLAIIDAQLDGQPVMQSLWEPTPQELASLNAGGFVLLTVWGIGHPPVSLTTHLPVADEREAHES